LVLEREPREGLVDMSPAAKGRGIQDRRRPLGAVMVLNSRCPRSRHTRAGFSGSAAAWECERVVRWVQSKSPGTLTRSRGVEVALGGMGTLIGPKVEVPIKLGDSRRALRRPAG
jgi:hypothetical protein